MNNTHDCKTAVSNILNVQRNRSNRATASNLLTRKN